MPEEELKLHGSIFFLLKKFVDEQISYGTWEIILEEVCVANIHFDFSTNYPLSIFNALVSSAAKRTDLSEYDLKENFGEYLVPDLLISYAAYLKPHWKTYELLENTEAVMHAAVRNLDSNAHPPILNVSSVDETLLIIDYHSKRKMACLAIGIIRGIATFYGERDSVKVVPTTDPDDERVQIRVEFQQDKVN